jgi:putative acetyltransferase
MAPDLESRDSISGNRRQPPWQIRPIRSDDDPAVAAIIRRVMPEFGADGAGFAIHDPEVNWMSRAYSEPRSAYLVVELRGAIAGGGGVAPLQGASSDICELRKMYFLPELRGLGAGRALIEHCLKLATGFGYARTYLETLSNMDAARRLYQAAGFQRLDAPLGATGHGGCNSFYLRQLDPDQVPG